ncbi:hypothetical protein TSTA_022830 [Talaromyces stipitatus ATCC 10500]|uniref:Uncharacterized protein n=1 Tax=Talaromyces stipitatus (strain ATCC 10500 / CBS 375.48 / QM 6759 / NRRL 1006) TaxID=441959 RepID=B8MI67_TALSN|nr:uncharacterized protein TSTA_022830 [Talaromyces stipitatus ATCC 10500]EED17229.1 hypothetical protein TSTA_022830 [Talaromyces stipitatus ATCC 10500]
MKASIVLSALFLGQLALALPAPNLNVDIAEKRGEEVEDWIYPDRKAKRGEEVEDWIYPDRKTKRGEEVEDWIYPDRK